MRKTILALLVALIMCFSMTACGEDYTGDEKLDEVTSYFVEEVLAGTEYTQMGSEAVYMYETTTEDGETAHRYEITGKAGTSLDNYEDMKAYAYIVEGDSAIQVVAIYVGETCPYFDNEAIKALDPAEYKEISCFENTSFVKPEVVLNASENVPFMYEDCEYVYEKVEIPVTNGVVYEYTFDCIDGDMPLSADTLGVFGMMAADNEYGKVSDEVIEWGKSLIPTLGYSPVQISGYTDEAGNVLVIRSGHGSDTYYYDIAIYYAK